MTTSMDSPANVLRYTQQSQNAIKTDLLKYISIAIFLQGFIGSHCQNKVDHCASHPCYNNGSCLNMGATYQCDCKMGFDG